MHFRRVELTGGRVHDFVILKDGGKVNSYIFVHAVEAVNREYEGCIRQFQVVQDDYGSFKVRLSVDEEASDIGITRRMIEEKFVSNVLHPDMAGAKYGFEFYSSLFSEGSSGKLCWFIRDVGVKEESE